MFIVIILMLVCSFRYCYSLLFLCYCYVFSLSPFPLSFLSYGSLVHLGIWTQKCVTDWLLWCCGSRAQQVEVGQGGGRSQGERKDRRNVQFYGGVFCIWWRAQQEEEPNCATLTGIFCVVSQGYSKARKWVREEDTARARGRQEECTVVCRIKCLMTWCARLAVCFVSFLIKGTSRRGSGLISKIYSVWGRGKAIGVNSWADLLNCPAVLQFKQDCGQDRKKVS